MIKMENKKTTVGIFLLIVMCSLCPAYECQDNMEYWNSPCEVITPVFNASVGCNASVLNINDSSMNYSIGLTPVGDGTNNFTFNQTAIATYSITVTCNNYSGTINLNMGTEEEEPGFNLWLVVFIIFSILIMAGAYIKNYILIFVSGCLPLLMGVYIFREGITIYGVDLWWVYPLGWIFIGIGLIITLLSSLKFMNENEGWRDRDNEYEGGGF